MLNIGDTVRLLQDVELPNGDEWEFVAATGDHGIVIDADHKYDWYCVKFHDGWGGTIELFHNVTDGPNYLEKIEGI